MIARLVVSANELNEFTEGALLLDTDGAVWRREPDYPLSPNQYWTSNDSSPAKSEMLADGRPFVVLYDPDNAGLNAGLISRLRDHLVNRVATASWGTADDLILFDFLSCWDKRHLPTTTASND